MTNSVQLFEQCGLINAKVNYSQVANAFLTTGYTSMAGNTYFNSIRVAEGIIIKEDVGEGWWKTFLNGIKIYSIKDKTLLADRSFHNLGYSKTTVRNHVKEMLINVLRDAAQSKGSYLDEREANRVIDRVLNQAMNEDQRELILQQSQKYLGA